MSELTISIGTATTLFNVIVVLAIVVFGFFKGRQWFRAIDGDGTESKAERDYYENGKTSKRWEDLNNS